MSARAARCSWRSTAQTLVKKLFDGLQPVADTWVNPLDPNYDEGAPKYPYDPAKAKALLAEAGWKPGPDGICRNDKGDRLSFEMSTTAGNRLRELTEQVLQSMWKAACVETTLKNEPARTFFGETVKQRKYQGIAMYAWSSAPDESPERTLGSGRHPDRAEQLGRRQLHRLQQPSRWTPTSRKATSELDPSKQKAVWADMQQHLRDRAAGPAAVLPRRAAYRAEMAEGLHPDRARAT